MTLRKKQIPLSYHNWLTIILWVGIISLPGPVFGFIPHLNLAVELEPEKHFISVKGNLVLPAARNTFTLFLHKDLQLSVEGAKLNGDSASSRILVGNKFRRYQLSDIAENGEVHFKYQGYLSGAANFDRSGHDQFGMPAMIFSKDSVYLDASSAWYPRLMDYPQFTFELKVNKPVHWEIISQGKRQILPDTVRYSTSNPQDSLYLLGGAFIRYARQHKLDNKILELEVYLLKDDPLLAERYLSLSGEFISQYSSMIGQYPYSKFAVVENRYQTGYGMPSFTLLGSRVIRLPFIFYSSLPHEILHNWWGNGVYVDYQKGNWSEGLTAYMADHLFSEKKRNDNEYRRKALEKYANFAAQQRDFPLAEFTSRHNQASQAVGYSKSLMVFHMLRKQLSDELFYKNMATFWQKYQFKEASFEQLIRTLTRDSNLGWHSFKYHWIDREGAPQLSLDKAAVLKKTSGYQLDLQISQTQAEKPYPLQLPVVIRFGDSNPVKSYQLKMDVRKLQVKLNFKHKPVSVSIDPAYDIFRLLSPQERPASLSRMFGASKQLLIYPHKATLQERKAWQTMAKSWQNLYDNVELLSDKEIETLPQDAAVWLLGWDNRLLNKYRHRFKADFQQIIDNESVIFDQQAFTRNQHAVVMLDANTAHSALGLIGAQQISTIIGLARKLPHYNSYGALVFKEDSVKNIFKRALPVLNSPLNKVLQ